MSRPDAGGRLLIAMAMVGLNQSELARAAGCSAAAVNRATKGRQLPTWEMMTVLIQRGISGSWLIAGVGPRSMPEPPHAPAGQDDLWALVGQILATGDPRAEAELRGYLMGLSGRYRSEGRARTA